VRVGTADDAHRGVLQVAIVTQEVVTSHSIFFGGQNYSVGWLLFTLLFTVCGHRCEIY